MAQRYTSKDTSVNTGKLPFLFSHLESLIGKAEKPDHYILDIGCGKETAHIREKVKSLGWGYIGYDPYNQDEDEQGVARLERFRRAFSCLMLGHNAECKLDSFGFGQRRKRFRRFGLRGRRQNPRDL